MARRDLDTKLLWKPKPDSPDSHPVRDEPGELGFAVRRTETCEAHESTPYLLLFAAVAHMPPPVPSAQAIA